MNDPDGHRPRRDRNRDAGLMFWYWLSVVGGGIALAFVLVGWLIGS
ncbi:hypothetical protein [Microvirga aerophila]|nr:hypothetical protein [Microvirga aerophila]